MNECITITHICTGMRSSAEVLIYIDVEKAMKGLYWCNGTWTKSPHRRNRILFIRKQSCVE